MEVKYTSWYNKRKWQQGMKGGIKGEREDRIRLSRQEELNRGSTQRGEGVDT